MDIFNAEMNTYRTYTCTCSTYNNEFQSYLSITGYPGRRDVNTALSPVECFNNGSLVEELCPVNKALLIRILCSREMRVKCNFPVNCMCLRSLFPENKLHTTFCFRVTIWNFDCRLFKTSTPAIKEDYSIHFRVKWPFQVENYKLKNPMREQEAVSSFTMSHDYVNQYNYRKDLSWEMELFCWRISK